VSAPTEIKSTPSRRSGAPSKDLRRRWPRFWRGPSPAHGTPELIGAHVVQENEISARRERLLNLHKCVGFDFDLELWILLASARYCRRD